MSGFEDGYTVMSKLHYDDVKLPIFLSLRVFRSLLAMCKKQKTERHKFKSASKYINKNA